MPYADADVARAKDRERHRRRTGERIAAGLLPEMWKAGARAGALGVRGLRGQKSNASLPRPRPRGCGPIGKPQPGPCQSEDP